MPPYDVVPESLTMAELGLWRSPYELKSQLLLLFTIVMMTD